MNLKCLTRNSRKPLFGSRGQVCIGLLKKFIVFLRFSLNFRNPNKRVDSRYVLPYALNWWKSIIRNRSFQIGDKFSARKKSRDWSLPRNLILCCPRARARPISLVPLPLLVPPTHAIGDFGCTLACPFGVTNPERKERPLTHSHHNLSSESEKPKLAQEAVNPAWFINIKLTRISSMLLPLWNF